jgi:predicted ATPase/DNA-binding SARP family transcriptional activator
MFVHETSLMTEGDLLAPLTIRLFGPFEVCLDSRPLPRLRTRKGQWALALLALRRGCEVERSWLAGTLWPDSSEGAAYTSLRSSLKDLRRALGVEAGRLRSPTPRTLSLELDGAAVDLIAFDEAVDRPDRAAWERAVALYRGPLLEGCCEAWVLQERGPREEAYLTALERLAAHAAARGDNAGAVRWLRQAVACDPFRETAQRALLTALAAGGDLAGVVEAYRAFRLRLQAELRGDPALETTALFRQLQAQERGRAERVGEGCSVFGVRSSVPPLPTPNTQHPTPNTEHPSPLPTAPRHLPRPISNFIGQEAAVRAVAAGLDGARLVTITGPGGVGKTRLAIRVADEVADAYRDGAWFVDLARAVHPRLVSQAVAAALGVREHADRRLPETLQQFLAGRELLLVLDNCEHLLPACAELAEALLSAAPALWILATSRQSLGLTGEVTWQLSGLSVPPFVFGVPSSVFAAGVPNTEHRRPNTEDPAALLQFDAVHLFVERARAASSAFAITARNAGSVGQICRQLDGIPLAIELAAARLKALSVEEIAARLDDRFGLLTGGSRTALPRQQTLRATMDWSYELLTVPERALLRHLSVFAGGFTLEAVEAVASGQWSVVSGQNPTVGDAGPFSTGLVTGHWPLTTHVLDPLTQLVDKSLVMVEAQEGETRYRLLETVRQYSSEQLQQSGEAATVRRRHEAFYLRLAEQAEAHRLGPDEVARLGRLDAEIDNLRAALASSLQGAPETALRAAAALAGYWENRGHLAEGRQWLAAALERAPRSAEGGPCSLARAAVLEGASALALLQEDRRAAQLLLEESLAIRREWGDRAGRAASLAHLAHVTCNRDDYPAARGLYDESLAIRRELEDQSGVATVLAGLGDVARRAGEYQEARSLLEESLVIRRALGDRYEITQSLIWLGDAVLELGESAAARAHYEEALAIRRELGDRAGGAGVLGELANVARWEGDYAEARRLREEGLAVWRAIGSPVAVLHSLGALGHLARDQGEYAEARHFYAESLCLRQELGDPYAIAQSLEDFAELAEAERQWARMVRLLAAAQALREAIQKPLRPREQADYDQLLAEARGALGDAALAAAFREGQAMVGLLPRTGQWQPAVAYALEAEK